MFKVFDIDQKLLATTTVAATATVALYSGYKFLFKKSTDDQQSHKSYETVKVLNKYLLFHYGGAEEILKWNFGPTTSLEFHKQCVDLCLKYGKDGVFKGGNNRALDVGCAVGRCTFELTRAFNEVVGIDYSQSFIDACNVLRDKGRLSYSALVEGDIEETLTAKIDPSIIRSKSHFLKADACSLPLDLGQFRCVLAINLLSSLHTPQSFLDRLRSLVAHQGTLVFADTFDFHRGITSKDDWTGGRKNIKDNQTVLESLKEHLSQFFTLLEEHDAPFLMREAERTFEWNVSHVTVWRRK